MADASPILRRRTPQWAAIILIATGIDLAARFLGRFDLQRILRVEGVLFLATAAALLLLLRHHPRSRGWRRGLQVGLIAAFALAGLRAGLWSIGASVMLANAVVLVSAVFGILLHIRSRRRRHHPDEPSEASAA